MLITEYMKKFISISLFISACFLGSCSSYDDERIWQDLNEIEKKRLEIMKLKPKH